MKKSRLDFTAWTRYWYLTLTWESESRDTKSWTKRYEKCICDCWNEVWISRSWLLRTKSCWCLQKKVCWDRLRRHWMRKTRIYGIFTDIKTRCYNQNSTDYKNYWWRWIKCLWNSFEEFYKDMWESYEEHKKVYWEKDTTIERIDVNWNYCKENCTWKTKKEQVNNQRSNTIVEMNWEKHNIWEWSKILWIPFTTLLRHIVKWKIKATIYTRWTWEIKDYSRI